MSREISTYKILTNRQSLQYSQKSKLINFSFNLPITIRVSSNNQEIWKYNKAGFYIEFFEIPGASQAITCDLTNIVNNSENAAIF
jgi:hypothetical protein